jgi:hypothetical protein
MSGDFNASANSGVKRDSYLEREGNMAATMKRWLRPAVIVAVLTGGAWAMGYHASPAVPHPDLARLRAEIDRLESARQGDAAALAEARKLVGALRGVIHSYQEELAYVERVKDGRGSKD